MYAYPVLLPEFSNREDLYFLVSLFDDDSGEPIDFSGRTLARPGGFTNNFWGVTVGNWTTFSGSVLTIPDYPIGAQLAAVSLLVDANLPIMPGDPVTIFDLPGGTSIIGPVGPPPTPIVGEDGTTYYVTETSGSGSIAPPTTYVPGPNTMTGYVISYAPQTGAMIVQVGLTFQFELRRATPMSDWDGYLGYSSQWDAGTWPQDPLITAQLGNGLMMIDTGVLQIRIPESIIRGKLRHRSYRLGLTVTDSYDTRQIAIAQLPMLYGGVTT